MRFFSLVIAAVVFNPFIAFATSDADKSDVIESSSKQGVAPLFNENRFTVYYAFEDKILSAALKETMIQQLQKIGIVYLADDSKLSEAQKQDKYRVGGMILDLSAAQIVEETGSGVSDYQKLPVFEICMKVISGAQILQNGSQLPATVWEEEKFIGVTKKKEEFIQKAIKATDNILALFVQEYQKANPKNEGKKPEFFLYF